MTIPDGGGTDRCVADDHERLDSPDAQGVDTVAGPEPLHEPASAERPSDTATDGVDYLCLFPSEASLVSRGHRQGLTAHDPQPSRGEPASVVAGSSATVGPDMTLDDLHRRLRQTDMALERSHRDAEALRIDLGQLRATGIQLAQEYATLGEACRHAEARSDAVAEALNTMEYRLTRLVGVLGLSQKVDDWVASQRPRANEIEGVAADVHTQQQSIDGGVDGGNPTAEGARVYDARTTTANEQEEVAPTSPIARVATLGCTRQLLAQTAATVGALERRALDVSAHGEAMTTVAGARADELVSLQPHLSLTQSGGPPPSDLRHSRPPARVPVTTDPSPASTPSAEAEEAAPSRWWAARGALLAVLTLLAIAVIRSRHPSYEHAIEGAAHGIPAASVSPRSPSALPSTTGSATTPLTAPVGSPGERKAIERNSDAASATGPVTFPSPGPAVVGGTLDRSDAVTSLRSREPPMPVRGVSGNGAAQPFSGTLRVESVPSGAAVFINQQRVGDTPLQLARVRAGSHVVWIERAGYERWSSSVQVAADTPNAVSATLQPLPDR